MANIKNSIYFSDELQKYLEQQADVYGLSKSGFLSMLLANHRQQNDALREMSKMEDYFKKMQELALVMKENNNV